MQTAIFEGPRTIRIAEKPLPQHGPREVLVRLEGCGLCASNLPVWEGRPWFTYPLEPGAPGHEAWGVIEAVGKEVTNFFVGNRVTFLSFHAYAQYDVADAATLVPLPPALSGKPSPGEPLACAMNILGRSDIARGQTVAVIGIGFLGALLTSLAVHAGARVVAVSRRPRRSRPLPCSARRRRFRSPAALRSPSACSRSLQGKAATG